MADTARTQAALLLLLADNTTGNISPQNLRDLVVSGPIGTDASTLTLTGAVVYFIGIATADPGVAGQVYSMDAAGLAAELAAGSRYLLISNGP